MPLSLATLPIESDYGVFEIGTNHPGEIEPLSRLVQPSVALLLNVHLAHVGNFVDHHALTREKLAIAQGLEANGTFVVEDEVAMTDTQLAALTKRGVRILRFGSSNRADVRFVELEEQAGATWAHYQIGGEPFSALVPGGGVHRALTLAAVLAVLQVLALPLSAAQSLRGDLVPTGRGNRREVGGVVVLDDSYNANPQSMSAALTALGQAQVSTGRRIAVIGDMLELGSESQKAHLALSQPCHALDGVWPVGREMAALVSRLPGSQRMGHADAPESVEASQQLAQQVASQLQPGDVVLVKGSKRIFWEFQFVEQLIAAIDAKA